LAAIGENCETAVHRTVQVPGDAAVSRHAHERAAETRDESRAVEHWYGAASSSQPSQFEWHCRHLSRSVLDEEIARLLIVRARAGDAEVLHGAAQLHDRDRALSRRGVSERGEDGIAARQEV